MWRGARWLHRDERGQDLLEFAVSALVLLMLLAGIADFGGAFQQYIIVTNAAREGARFASRAPCTSSTFALYKTATLNAAIAEAAQSNLTVVAADVALLKNGIAATSCVAAGSPIVVTVKHRYTATFVSLVGFNNLDLKGSVEMISFGNTGSG